MTELGYVLLGFAVVGIVFIGIYAFDRRRFWWAIIPGLGAFTLLGALAVDAYVGTDPSNDWASVLVIAGGAAIIAAALPDDAARRVLDIVAGFALGIGILMSPIDVALKVVFIALLVAGGAMLAWGRRGHATTLRPHH